MCVREGESVCAQERKRESSLKVCVYESAYVCVRVYVCMRVCVCV